MNDPILDCIEQQLKNINHINYSESKDQKLSEFRTRYYFIDKNTSIHLNTEQLANKLNRSTKTIRCWIYKKHHFLLDNYKVVKERVRQISPKHK